MPSVPLDFEGFCHEHYVPLIRLLTLYCGDPEVSRDLAQETLARTYASWPRVRGMQHPRLWVNRVAINLANSHFRRRGSERKALMAEASRALGGSDQDAAVAVTVRLALATLSHRQRAAIILRFFNDLSVDETARLMTCSAGTVKKLTARGLHALRAGLGDDIEVEVRDA